MRCNSVVVCSVAALTAVALAQVVSAQNRPAAPAAAPPATTAAAPAVAEAADRLIKEMSAYLGSANEFTFHADVTFDHVLPSGQKLKFSSTEEVVMKRPDGLYVEWNGDLGARRFWYDGKSVTLYDPAMPFYASDAAPADLDADAAVTALYAAHYESLVRLAALLGGGELPATELAFRARTRKIAWKASSASCTFRRMR